MSGRPRQPSVSPAEELREATRDAHAAVKDLRQAILQAKVLAGQVTLEMTELMKAAANDEMRRAWDHIQRDANRNSKSLHEAVEVARKAIVKMLTPEFLEPLGDGRYRVVFELGNFDPEPVEIGVEVSDIEPESEASAEAGPDPAPPVDPDAADRGERP